MKQPVIVHSVGKDSTIQVRYPDPKSEKSNTSRSFWNVKERSFPASNRRKFVLHEGDMVEIHVDPFGAIKAAFMVFIFPLLCFLLFYNISLKFSSSEPVLYLTGTCGLFAGFFTNVLIRKIKGPGEMPSVEKILSQADILKWKSCNSACKTCRGCG